MQGDAKFSTKVDCPPPHAAGITVTGGCFHCCRCNELHSTSVTRGVFGAGFSFAPWRLLANPNPNTTLVSYHLLKAVHYTASRSPYGRKVGDTYFHYNGIGIYTPLHAATVYAT